MCGIVGYIGEKKAVPILLEGLKRLEYRGYDSAGLAVIDQALAVRAARLMANSLLARPQWSAVYVLVLCLVALSGIGSPSAVASCPARGRPDQLAAAAAVASPACLASSQARMSASLSACTCTNWVCSARNSSPVAPRA